MIGLDDFDHEHPAEEENVSMTDMMVGLVFIFIILLMYFALQFRETTEQFRKTTEQLTKTTDQLTSAERTRSAILFQLEEYLKAKGVKVEIDTETGVLRLPDEILFDSAHAEVKPEGVVALGHLANGLMLILPCYTNGVEKPADCPSDPHMVESVFIEGHTDTDKLLPHAGLTDNWDLSVLRATNTYRQLTGMRTELSALCILQQGVTCNPVLSVSGYADRRPVAPGADEAAKRRNRRIDLRILMATPKSADVAPIDEKLQQAP
jgi:flagellar motor protein MotB